MSERALNTVLDLPIVASDEVHLGDVTDVLISIPEQRVVALIVDWSLGREQISGPSDTLPLSQIAAFDPHQLVVHSEFALTAGLDFSPYDEGGLVLATELLDHEVVTRSGLSLGTLTDVFFDELDGGVMGYEVERKEAALPARVIGPTTELEIGQDRVIVPDRLSVVSLAALHEMEEGQEAEQQEFVFEASLAERPTEEPDLIEESGSQP